MAPLSKSELSRGRRCFVTGSGNASTVCSASSHASRRGARAPQASSAVRIVTGESRADAKAERESSIPLESSIGDEEAAASVDPKISPRVGGLGPRAAVPSDDPGNATVRLAEDMKTAVELAAQRCARAAARTPIDARRRSEHSAAHSQLDAHRPTSSAVDPKFAPQWRGLAPLRLRTHPHHELTHVGVVQLADGSCG